MFEEVFTFLSERNRAPRTSIQFQAYTKRVWEALLFEIGQSSPDFSRMLIRGEYFERFGKITFDTGIRLCRSIMT